MNRGEIRWYSFKPSDKRRPVLLLTRNPAVDFLTEPTVAPITSTIRNIPSEIILNAGDGMAYPCAANFDHLQTISKARLGDLTATLSPERMDEATQALSFALDLENT